MSDNPWDNDPVIDDKSNTQPSSGGNPWDNDPTVDSPVLTNEQAPTPPQETEEERVTRELNQMNSGEIPSAGNISSAQASQEEMAKTDVARMQDEFLKHREELSSDKSEMSWDSLYGPIAQKYGDRIRRLYESQHGVAAITDPTMFLGEKFLMNDDDREKVSQMSKELEDAYLKTGTEQKIMGVPYRVFTRSAPNPQYDATQPVSDENPQYIEKKEFVTPPQMNAMARIGAIAARSLATGFGDLATGNIVKEGPVSKAIPEVASNSGGEKIIGELTSFMVGGAAATKAVKVGGEAVSGATKIAMVPVYQKMVSMMNPEMVQKVQKVYSETLNATGNVDKAMRAANSLTKQASMGLALSLSDASLSDSGSTGMISPETVKNYLNVSDERAQDVSVALDTPIFGGLINTLGMALGTAKRTAGKAIGGVRNMAEGTPFSGLINNSLTLSEKDAGFAALFYLDPNLRGLPPEEFYSKTKIFGDALANAGTVNQKLAGAGKAVKMDSPAAFMRMSQDYYSTAYQNLKDTMGPEKFKAWVDEQSQLTATRFYEIKSSVANDAGEAARNAQFLNDQQDLMQEGANSVSKKLDVTDNSEVLNTNNPAISGDLKSAQSDAAEILAQNQKQASGMAVDIQEAAQREKYAARDRQIGAMDERARAAEERTLASKEIDYRQQEVERAKETVTKGLESDPNLQQLMKDYDVSNNLGSTTEMDRKLSNELPEPLYRSYKVLRENERNAYKAIADTGANIDEVAFLNKVKELNGGPELPKPLKDIVDKIHEDPSFGNVYNNISNLIQKKIDTAPIGDPLRNTYVELRRHIKNEQPDLIANMEGFPEIKGIVENAKKATNDIRTTFGDNQVTRQIGDVARERMAAEKLPAGYGPGQGVNDFKIKTLRSLGQLNGPESEVILNSLRTAAKGGGESIDRPLSEYYITKGLSKISNTIETGGSQSVGNLRNALRESINTLEQLGSPEVSKFRAIEERLNGLGKELEGPQAALDAAKKDLSDKDLVYQMKSAKVTSAAKQSAQVQREVAEINKEVQKMHLLAQKSIGAKFIKDFNPRLAKDLPTTANPDEVFMKLFDNKESGNYIKDLYSKADQLGGPQAEVIKSAVQGSYMDYIKNKILTGKKVEGGVVVDSGNLKFKAADIDNFFNQPRVQEDLKSVFSDNPEIVKQISDIVDTTKINLGKLHVQGQQSVLNPLPQNLDPKKGLNTLINLTFGVLNPTSTKIRNVLGPMSVDKLEQVKQMRRGVLVSMIEDPDQFKNVLDELRKGELSKDVSSKFRKLVAGSLAKITTHDNTDYQDDVVQERLKEQTNKLLNSKK